MKITILTLFPEFIESIKEHSIIKRAIDRKLLTLEIINFRDYTENKHKKVDDYVYGGGQGMLLTCQPIVDALDAIKTDKSKIFLMSPKGKMFNQKFARQLATKEKHIVLVCGHYEGFDHRINSFVDGSICTGEYVLTGGELPAMTVLDAITRLLPGVIKEESHLDESFEGGFLEYPNYTKPADFRGLKVPDVLMSGDHKKIQEWKEKNKTKY